MTHMTPFKKTIAGGLAALTLATSVVALSSTSASAQWRRGGWGPGIAAGVIGGLAVGALAAGAYGPRYYYGPAAYPYPYPYGGCYYAPQQVWNGYRWVVRRVEVCN
jgi:hypothetical protein